MGIPCSSVEAAGMLQKLPLMVPSSKESIMSILGAPGGSMRSPSPAKLIRERGMLTGIKLGL